MQDYFYDLLEVLPIPDLDLKSQFLMVDKELCRPVALNELNRRARWTVENVKVLQSEGAVQAFNTSVTSYVNNSTRLFRSVPVTPEAAGRFQSVRI